MNAHTTQMPRCCGRTEERKQRVPQEQQGSVLIVSMLILLVLTLIGVTAMGTSALEEKMAGNSRDQNLAFQASEAALRDAEGFITNLATTANFNGTLGLYPIGANPNILLDATWLTARSYPQAPGGSALPNAAAGGVNSPPRFIVEMISSVGTTTITIGGGYGGGGGGTVLTTFRVTTRGTGGTDNASVLLQSHFARNF